MEMSNAGFTITDIYQTSRDRCSAEGVAFGVKRNKYIPGGYEYVTWNYTESEGQFDFYWGHYFGSEKAAEEDFRKRAGILSMEEVIRG